MLLLKRIDFYGQLILITGFLLLFLAMGFDLLSAALIVIGGWQLLSTLFHFLNRDHLLRNTMRRYFEVFLIVIISCGLTSFMLPTIRDVYTLLVFWFGPLLAGWYAYISFIELKTWEARALIHLK